jgi:hypothetical protein
MKSSTQTSSFASTNESITVIQTLASIGLASTDKFTDLNVSASIAAIDNSTHHYSMLASSNRLVDLIELQIQSLLPAAESAKAYLSQVFTFGRTMSHQFEQVLEAQMSGIQDRFCESIYSGLTVAEEQGLPSAKFFKDSLQVSREAALSTKASITRQLHSN